MKNAEYLVTGGCGFIGSHIVEELIHAGKSVRILDDLSSGHEENIAPWRDQVDVAHGSICDPSIVQEAMKGIRYVYHKAALVSVFDSVEQPMRNHDINMTGMLNVLQAARDAGVQRLVFASSAAIYGNDPTLPKVETMLPQPASPYAAAKITGEYYCRIFAELYGLETVCLRYMNVFGPRQDPASVYSGVISVFTNAFKAGRVPVIYGDGLQTRDFVFVKDVVQANMLAMHRSGGGKGEVFNIGTGISTSLLDLVAALQNITGQMAEPTFRPARAGDIRHSYADISLAKKILNYSAEFTLEQGLQAIMDSM
ncbi:MAG: SDR family oxidoreductase [Spartobacteria bacterium]|nr:SDR family oxidoreductase [Spartobacteria bacterium]